MIFGVYCEGLPRQMNYLIDEASDTGKGANMIVSMFHHFFVVHGLGETTVHLHADNYVGQNKNSTMLQYLLWRVMVGLHHSITLSFLVVGHTKFSPDWCFGLLKQRFRWTKVGCLNNLVKVVNSSAGVNIAQLVGTQEGEKVVTHTTGRLTLPSDSGNSRTSSVTSTSALMLVHLASFTSRQLPTATRRPSHFWSIVIGCHPQAHCLTLCLRMACLSKSSAICTTRLRSSVPKNVAIMFA